MVSRQAYGQDLRDRVLACSDMTLVQVVTRFGVSPSYVSKVRAGLRTTGLVAPLVPDGAIDGAAFLAYTEQFLVPTLRPGSYVGATLSCSTISARTRSAVCERRSRPQVRRCSTCRPRAHT